MPSVGTEIPAAAASMQRTQQIETGISRSNPGPTLECRSKIPSTAPGGPKLFPIYFVQNASGLWLEYGACAAKSLGRQGKMGSPGQTTIF